MTQDERVTIVWAIAQTQDKSTTAMLALDIGSATHSTNDWAQAYQKVKADMVNSKRYGWKE